MKIFKITAQPLNTAVLADKPNNSNNNITVLKVCPNDSVNFTSKKLLPEEIEKIDNYILNLKAIKAVRENAAKKLKVAEEVFTEKMNKINEQILPLIKDEGFLWAIEPKESKNKLSNFVVKNAYIEGLGYSAEIHQKSWNKVYDTIRNRILSTTPDKIQFEELSAMPTRKYQINLIQLKELVAKKAALAAEHKTQISTINSETFTEMMPFSSKNSDINFEIQSKTPTYSVVEDFHRLVAKRAMEKEPDLKEIRLDAYKTYFNKYKQSASYMKIGKFKQQASNYANQEVISHLEGTTNADRPF